MKQRALFIHGAGDDAYSEDAKMVESLRAALGAGYELAYPRMPNAGEPEHAPWSAQLTKELEASSDAVILVGHSFGASTLLKHLSEEQVGRPITGLFLIATPYWSAEEGKEWQKQYALEPGAAAKVPRVPLFFYHSRDDEFVPFEHLALYRKAFPHATCRELEGVGHQLDNDLTVVARDIQAATKR
jgi:uncharacterized protein